MAGYGDDNGFTAWLTANGYALPAGAPSVAAVRQRGATVVDATYGARFVGEPTAGVAQERAWPRIGAFAKGQAIADNVVPNDVIVASYHAGLAAASSTGQDTSIYSPGVIKRDKVGDAETEFADLPTAFQWSDDIPLTILDGLLAPYLRRSSGIGIWSVG